MIKVNVSYTVFFEEEDLPPVYLNEEALAEAIEEYIEDSLNELSPSEITIKHIDVEGIQ